MGVLPRPCGPLFLGFGHAPAAATVEVMDLGQGNEGQRSNRCKHDCGNQHDECNQNIRAEVRDGRQPTTNTPPRDANALNDANSNLGHEDKEERHKVERAVTLESFVYWPEPTHIGTGREHDEPNDGQPEVCDSTSCKHPGKAADEVHSKCRSVQHPQVVHLLTHAAVLFWDVIEILMEAGFDWEKLGKRGKVWFSHLESVPCWRALGISLQ